MLRGENTSVIVTDQKESNEFVFQVRNQPVMKIAIDLISRFGKTKKLVLKARENSIPNAVAIANILTEKMLKGTSKIEKISVDSEIPDGVGKMISTIEIIIGKN